MSSIEKLRGKMDAVSLEIVALLLERRHLAELVIEEKRTLQQEIWDPDREKQLMRLLTQNLSESERQYIEEIFKTIFICTRGRQ